MPVQPAASATIAVALVPAAALASQSSGQTTPRQIYGVAQEEAEFRQTRRVKLLVKSRPPEPSREDEVHKRPKRRQACFMKGCGKPPVESPP